MKKLILFTALLYGSMLFGQNPARFPNGISLPNATDRPADTRIPVMTSTGEIIGYVDKSDFELTLGNPASDGQILSSTTAGVRSWIDAPSGGGGSGDVTSALNFGTDNSVIRSDGTLKGVQSSNVTIDDVGNLTGPATIVATFGLAAGSGIGTNTGGYSNTPGALTNISGRGEFGWTTETRFTLQQTQTGQTDTKLHIDVDNLNADRVLTMPDTNVDLAATIPTGGTLGQVLSKIDGTDYNTQWVNVSGGSNNSLSESNQVLPASTTRTVDVPNTSIMRFLSGVVNIMSIHGSDNSVRINGSPEVTDDPYANTWDGNNTVPTKNSTYDRMDALNKMGEFEITGDYTVLASDFARANGTLIYNSATNGRITIGDVAENSEKLTIAQVGAGKAQIDFTGGAVRDDIQTINNSSVVTVWKSSISGVGYLVAGATEAFSLIPTSANLASLQTYITADEQTGSDGASITSVSDQKGNVTGITATNVTLNIQAGKKEFEVSGNGRIDLGNNINFGATPSFTILFVTGALDMNSALFAKGNATGSDYYYSIYNSQPSGAGTGYHYAGGSTEGAVTFQTGATDGNDFVWMIGNGDGTYDIRFNGATVIDGGTWGNEDSTANLLLGAQVNGAGYNDQSTGSFRVFAHWNATLTPAEMTAIEGSGI